MITFIKKYLAALKADDSGFSLMEILVATAIASMMLIMLQQFYDSSLKSMDKLVAKAEIYENISLAISKIDNDFSNAYLKRTNKKLTFICEVKEDNSVLNFVTINHFDFQMVGSPSVASPISDIKEVGYYLRRQEVEGNPTDLFKLVRREQNLYDDEPQEGGRESLLLENVISLKFQFREGNDWTDRWDSRNTQRYPQTIKTTIKVYKGKSDVEIQINDETTEVYEFVSRVNIQP